MSAPHVELPERPGWSGIQKAMVAGIVVASLAVVAILGVAVLEIRRLEQQLLVTDDASEQFVAVLREAGQLQVALLQTGSTSAPEVTERLALLERHIAVLDGMPEGLLAPADNSQRAARVVAERPALAEAIADGDTEAAVERAGTIEVSAKVAADRAETQRRATLLDQVAVTRAVALSTLGAVVLVLLVILGLLASVRRRSQSAYREAYDLARAHAGELRRSNEELREANQAKQRFVSMVSHELRTPLTVIRGFAETLARHGGDLDQAQRDELADSIVRQALRQQRMVEDLLVLSRHTEQSPAVTPMALDVSDFVARVIAETNLPAGTSAQLLRGPECVAWADPHHIEQVMDNLLTNAVKYGGSHIEVSWTRSRDQVVLVVEDDGTGVPERFVPHLFAPFSQADDGDTRVSRGVGLGLTISDLLVTANGGSITYSHRDRGGARFEVTLPRTTAAHTEAPTFVDRRGDEESVVEIDRRAPVAAPWST